MRDGPIVVYPLRPLQVWFMRKDNFDAHDAALIDELLRCGVLENREAPATPPARCPCGAVTRDGICPACGPLSTEARPDAAVIPFRAAPPADEET